MKLLSALALLALFGLPSRARSENLFTPDRACACDPKVQDPMEEPIHFAFGQFQGQCVDSCRFRRARVIEEKKGGLVVANVLHLGKYRRAVLPLDKVQSAEIGFERFAPGVDHVLLRFTFSVDVPLFDQTAPGGKPAAMVRTIVLSSEGVPPKGHKYSLVESFEGNYLLGHRLITGDELLAWVEKRKHPLRFLPLNLGGAQAAAVLQRGIQRSDGQSFRTAYQLFSNNCSTSALSILDAETGYRIEGWDPLHWVEFEGALPIVGPFGTRHALEERKLLGSPQPAVREAHL